MKPGLLTQSGAEVLSSEITEKQSTVESTAAFNFLSNIRAIPFSDIPARCIRMTSWKRRWM